MTDSPKRGWVSDRLPVVNPDDLSYWSTSDAAMLLGSDLTAAQIRALIRLAGLQPSGKRRGIARKGGRYVRVYSAVSLIRAHEAIQEAMGLDSGTTVSAVPDQPAGRK